MKTIYNLCFSFAAVLFVIGSILIYQGFDKKLNYYNSDSYPSLNKNVYVGGDAYNYIINSNYFTGYSVLGCSAFICATLLICIGLYLRFKDTNVVINKDSNQVLQVQQEEMISKELPSL